MGRNLLQEVVVRVSFVDMGSHWFAIVNEWYSGTGVTKEAAIKAALSEEMEVVSVTKKGSLYQLSFIDLDSGLPDERGASRARRKGGARGRRSDADDAGGI